VTLSFLFRFSSISAPTLGKTSSAGAAKSTE